jgi:hypothetical protein
MKIEDMFASMENEMMAIIAKMDWAESEIAKAQDRHNENGRGPIWRSFRTIRQNDPFMMNEKIYRAHCREILDRVAAGKDVRPGTDAEMIGVLHQASLRAPMPPGMDCLYFRIMARTFPDLFAKVMSAIDLASYEKIHGSTADDHERHLREKLARERG